MISASWAWVRCSAARRLQMRSPVVWSMGGAAFTISIARFEKMDEAEIYIDIPGSTNYNNRKSVIFSISKEIAMPQFTKRALEDSLKRLLSKKPLNKITVSDIIEDCGISRPTFYYHFKDIYDLVDWVCLEDARVALDGQSTYDTWQQGFTHILYAVKENKPFIINVYRCLGRNQVQQFLTPLADSLMMNIIQGLSAEMTIREEDSAFVARIYSYILIGLVLDWVQDDMKGVPEKIVEKLSMVIHGNISGALNRLRLDRPMERTENAYK